MSDFSDMTDDVVGGLTRIIPSSSSAQPFGSLSDWMELEDLLPAPSSPAANPLLHTPPTPSSSSVAAAAAAAAAADDDDDKVVEEEEDMSPCVHHPACHAAADVGPVEPPLVMVPVDDRDNDDRAAKTTSTNTARRLPKQVEPAQVRGGELVVDATATTGPQQQPPPPPPLAATTSSTAPLLALGTTPGGLSDDATAKKQQKKRKRRRLPPNEEDTAAATTTSAMLTKKKKIKREWSFGDDDLPLDLDHDHHLLRAEALSPPSTYLPPSHGYGDILDVDDGHDLFVADLRSPTCDDLDDVASIKLEPFELDPVVSSADRVNGTSVENTAAAAAVPAGPETTTTGTTTAEPMADHGGAGRATGDGGSPLSEVPRGSTQKRYQGSPARPSVPAKAEPFLAGRPSPSPVESATPVAAAAEKGGATSPEPVGTGAAPVSGTAVAGGVSLAEKRRIESARFPSAALASLAGTTSAEVRRMSGEERELVLFKRKLRNRESARRSRQKRQATLAELQDEVDELTAATGRMVDIGLSVREDNESLRKQLELAHAELRALRSVCAMNNAAPATAGATGAIAGERAPEVLPGRPSSRPTVPAAEAAKLGG